MGCCRTVFRTGVLAGTLGLAGATTSLQTSVEPGWARACGDGRIDAVVDALDDITAWSVCCSDGNRATVALRSAAGCSGQALAIDYHLNGPYPAGAEWWLIGRPFSPALNLGSFTHLRVAFRGSNPLAHHNVQFKLIDDQGRIDWFVTESAADLPVWRTVYLDLDAFTCFDHPARPCEGRLPHDLDRTAVVRLEIAVGRCLRANQGTIQECEPDSAENNVLSVDEIAAVDLRPGAPHRLAADLPMRVPPDASLRVKAALALRDRQELNGLVPAWYEEPVANYNTYAQAMRILVLAREFELTADPTFRDAAIRAIVAMLSLQRGTGTPNAGAWHTAYEWNGGSFVPRDGCSGNETATPDVDRCFWVGNTAWMMIALNRARAASIGDSAVIGAAIGRAADWIVANVGRLRDAPRFVTYGLEGNISAYFGLLAASRWTEAASLGHAIGDQGWHPVQRRMKVGILPHQTGTALDTAGSWGVHLLRSLGRDVDARDSQAYIASMFRVRSFDGTRDGYGDVEGPWSVTVEFGAQGAEAGIPGAAHTMNNIAPLQAADGTFPGSPDNFLGGSAWLTTWHGVAPTAWVYLVQTGSPLQASAQIAEVWPLASCAAPGQTVQLWARTLNDGMVPLPSDAKGWFFVNGASWPASRSHWVGAAPAGGITEGSSVWHSFEWTVPADAAAGTYYYWAQTWSGGTAISPWSSAQAFCVEPSRAEIASLWPVTGAGPGRTVTLWALVNNTGTTAMPSAERVWFFVNGPSWPATRTNWVGSASIGGLRPGESRWYFYDWTIPSDAEPGTYYYWAQAWRPGSPISPWSPAQSFAVTATRSQSVATTTRVLESSSKARWRRSVKSANSTSIQ